jgi:4-hydroxy-2-oxoheptanedioate aldolase
MKGLIDGGPTNSGHRTPPIIVEAPVEGTSEAIIRFNAWQFRQILARGVHGVILCTAETPDAVRAFVESCRYPINMQGVGYGVDRGTRGTGSQPTSAPVWGVTTEEYVERADPWPLNPDGELLLGVKIESVRALSNVEQTLTVPGVAFAEWGPGDMHMSFGIKRDRSKPLDPRLVKARTRVRDACKTNGVAFLDSCTPENIIERIKEGVRIVAGRSEEIAKIGRTYTKRMMAI